MHETLRLAAAVCATLAVGCSPAAERPETDSGTDAAARRSVKPRTWRPDPVRRVLLVTVDTLRADALGFAGDAAARTPHLDRLAARGHAFTDAYAHNVMTLPSHANILTGRYPFEHGIRDNSGFVLGDSLPTLASLLGGAGWATAAFVGAFPLDARYGLGRGFEVYDDAYPEGSAGGAAAVPERPGGEVVAAALEWWRSDDPRPRFLWLHLFDPHAPYRPPAEHAAGDPYRGEVAAVDAYLGPLLEAAADPASPALVVFTSDHGESLGEHGERTHGLFAYQATLRVPLVLAAPGLEPARRDDLARHVDLLPTVLDALGMEPPPGLPGRSLLATPADGAPASYFEALSPALNRGWAPLRGVVAAGHKLILLPLPELYDLERDPAEADNLIERDRRRAAELRALVPEESSWPPPARSVSDAERRRLESLGYLASAAKVKTAYTAADDPKNLVELDRRIHEAIDLYQRRELEAARRLAAGVVDERPDMGVAYYYLAQIDLERGAREAALATMRRAHERGAATPALLRQYALTLVEVGRAAEAVSLLEGGAASADPDLLNALGLALAEAGRAAEARRTLERVFAIDPRNPITHETLALAALRLGDWAEAARQAERALALDGRLALSWNYLGAARLSQGRVDEALAAWRSAVEVDPDDLDALYNLGFAAARAGRRETAIPALRAYVAKAPRDRLGREVAEAEALLARLGG